MKVKFTTTFDSITLREAKKKAIDENKNLNQILEEFLRKWTKKTKN